MELVYTGSCSSNMSSQSFVSPTTATSRIINLPMTSFYILAYDFNSQQWFETLVTSILLNNISEDNPSGMKWIEADLKKYLSITAINAKGNNIGLYYKGYFFQLYFMQLNKGNAVLKQYKDTLCVQVNTYLTRRYNPLEYDVFCNFFLIIENLFKNKYPTLRIKSVINKEHDDGLGMNVKVCNDLKLKHVKGNGETVDRWYIHVDKNHTLGPLAENTLCTYKKRFGRDMEDLVKQRDLFETPKRLYNMKTVVDGFRYYNQGDVWYLQLYAHSITIEEYDDDIQTANTIDYGKLITIIDRSIPTTSSDERCKAFALEYETERAKVQSQQNKVPQISRNVKRKLDFDDDDDTILFDESTMLKFVEMENGKSVMDETRDHTDKTNVSSTASTTKRPATPPPPPPQQTPKRKRIAPTRINASNNEKKKEIRNTPGTLKKNASNEKKKIKNTKKRQSRNVIKETHNEVEWKEENANVTDVNEDDCCELSRADTLPLTQNIRCIESETTLSETQRSIELSETESEEDSPQSPCTP